MANSNLALALGIFIYGSFTDSLNAEILTPETPATELSGTREYSSSALFSIVRIGSMPLIFDETTLAQIKSKYGGIIQHHGDAGSSKYWLCYSSEEAENYLVVWFFSDGEMGGPDHTINSVSIEKLNIVNASSGCSFIPKFISELEIDVPTVGASASQLLGRFGGVSQGENNQYFSFSHHYKGGPTQSFDITQTLFYRVESDQVVSLSLTQVQSN